jgi:hypothetical protein
LKKIIFLLAISAITYLSAGFYFKLYSINAIFNKLKTLDYKVIISGNLYEQIAIVAIGILTFVFLLLLIKFLFRKKSIKRVSKNNIKINKEENENLTNSAITGFPYDNLAQRISGITLPFRFSKFESIFLDISRDTKIEKIQKMDIQNDLCDVYRISPKGLNKQFISLPPAHFLYKIQVLLILGEKHFYLMIHCGNEGVLTPHTFNTTIAEMRISNKDYSLISSGRFLNKKSNNFVSAEEDEFGKNYIVVTNSEWLMNADETFSFCRNLFTI